MPEEKSFLKIAREKAKMTRSEVQDATGFITTDRLEKIENGKTKPSPDDIVKLQEIYKIYDLCDTYCSKECAIGQKRKPVVALKKDVSKVIMNINVTLHKLNQDRDRLQEIMLDDTIEESEIKDFARIQDLLEQISILSRALQIWVDEQISSGNLDGDALNKAKNSKE